MNIGISTGCLYPKLTEDSLETLCGLGFNTFEVFFNSFSELEYDYTERLARVLDRNNAHIVSIHPFTSSYESFLLFSNYERRFNDGVLFYEVYFRTAQRLGADKVILHGLNTSYRSTITDEEYFRRFSVLQDRAKAYGVELLQENVDKFRSGSNSFIASMRKSLNEKALFVCDTKQAFRSGTTPTEAVRTMGKGLRHIHISGNSQDNNCILPVEGCSFIEPFFEYLSSSGYSGDIIIEVYRFSFDRLNELTKAKAYLEAIAEKYRLL